MVADKVIDLTVHPKNDQFLNGAPGQEPYKLYKYITDSFDGISIIEFGVLYGASLMVFTSNRKNVVFGYDIEDQRALPAQGLINVYFEQTPALSAIERGVSFASLIFVDISHNGVDEWNVLNKLKEYNYHGVTLWDDIHLNPEMESFFNNVREEKIDLTEIGHFSGTGAIIL